MAVTAPAEHPCFESANGYLARHNTRLMRSIAFDSEMNESYQLVIATERIDPKRAGRVTPMFATYCPFCGKKIGGQRK